MSDENEKHADDKFRWAVFSGVALVELLLIVKLFLSAPTPEFGLPMAVVVTAGLLVLSPRLFDIVSFELGKGGLRTQLRDVRQRLDETNARIDRLFMVTMSPTMFENLKKLASGRFGPYEMGTGLRRELYYLRDIGYIKVESIRNIPTRGENLSDHVEVRPAGKEFVQLREAMEAEAP